MEQIRLGKLVGPGDERRDAVHIAYVPVTAAHALRPGQKVGLSREGLVGDFEPYLGVVDPWLWDTVAAGQRFLLCLDPGSVTGLRHVYEHPAFPNEPALETNTLIAAYLKRKLGEAVRT